MQAQTKNQVFEDKKKKKIKLSEIFKFKRITKDKPGD